MKTKTESAEIIDLPLGAGTTFRVSLTRNENGEPERLVLVCGFGGGEEPFTRNGWGPDPLSLPGQMLPQIIEALTKLQATLPQSTKPGPSGVGQAKPHGGGVTSSQAPAVPTLTTN